MVSISLRAYLSEISDMVDQHQLDEAIAHCRHILEEHPKHVDTYRLLGKAYLEEPRYGDAADILQRVLSSIPEDFISQVGMSIIREDEGNIDSAIYHMERAFETQPSNHAIQAELRRLHGVRDGIEPPRIKLTRGALARMYAHGHLYDQAIQELLAALTDEPLRFDLQSLLADMYYRADKKVDAAETCTRILEKLPYCLNANRLLTKILEESGNAEEAARYRGKWAALDPYAAFVGSEFAVVDQVSDNKVSLEHYEWDPGNLYTSDASRPAWASSLGVSIPDGDTEDEALPDWLEREVLSDGETGDPFDRESVVNIEAPTESLSYEKTEDGYLVEDSPTDHTQPSRLDPPKQDEMDWMAEFKTESLPGSGDEDEDWLSAVESPPGDPSQGGDEDDWLASLEIPDAMPEEAEAAPSEDLPAEDDWLSSLETPGEEMLIEETSPSAGPLEDETDPESDQDWLASLGVFEDDEAEPEQPSQEKEIPDFLKDAGWEPGSGDADEAAPVEYVDEDEIEAQPLEQAEIPDWIQNLAPSVEEQATEEEENAEADPEWLKSLEGAPVTKSPDWLGELDPEQADQPPADEIEAPPEETLEMEAGLEIEADEADLAWLEGLAAKQGIPDEELVTTPEQRAEAEELTPDLPGAEEPDEDLDWLKQMPGESPEEPADDDWLAALGTEEEPADEPEARAPSPVSKEEDSFDSSWLDSISQEAAEEAAEPTVPATEEPAEDDWLAAIGAEEEPADEPEARAPSPVSEEEDSFDSSWLDSISQEAAEEAAEASAPAAEEPADDDWLAALGAEEDTPDEPEPAVPSPVSEEEDSFDSSWLDSISQEAAEEAAEASAPAGEEPADDDWLAALGAEEDTPDEPEPAVPSPVSEEEDSFDTAWLTSLSQEAAEEAAEASAPAAEEPAEDDWLAELTPDETDDATIDRFLAAQDILGNAEEEAEAAPGDWLSQLGEPAETPEAVVPEDEEDDHLDTDWLRSISEQAAQEAGEPQDAPPEEPVSDTQQVLDWLTDLDDSPAAEEAGISDEDLDIGLLDELDDTLDQPESTPAADDAEDELDTDWLKAISQEAAEEASEEPPAHESETGLDWLSEAEDEADQPALTAPADEEADDVSDSDWLPAARQEASGETVQQTPEPAEEDDWLAKLEAETDEAQSIADTDAWLKSMEVDDAPLAEEEPDAFEMKDSGDWLDEIGLKPESPQPAEDEETEPALPEDEDTPEMELGEVPLPTPEADAGIQPTDSGDWKPEIAPESGEAPAAEDDEAVPAPVEEQADPEPAGLAPDSPEGELLGTARAALSGGDLEQAIRGYAKLIKKGKLIPEVIEDIIQAVEHYPISPELWQTLGDAQMKSDHMAEAFEAYSKAEELLR